MPAKRVGSSGLITLGSYAIAVLQGNGSVLDNTCILITNDMNEGANHWVANTPYLIIGSCGGFFKQGVSVGLSQRVPNNRLLTSICHAMGLDIAGIGNYSGDMDLETRA